MTSRSGIPDTHRPAVLAGFFEVGADADLGDVNVNVDVDVVRLWPVAPVLVTSDGVGGVGCVSCAMAVVLAAGRHWFADAVSGRSIGRAMRKTMAAVTSTTIKPTQTAER